VRQWSCTHEYLVLVMNWGHTPAKWPRSNSASGVQSVHPALLSMIAGDRLAFVGWKPPSHSPQSVLLRRCWASEQRVVCPLPSRPSNMQFKRPLRPSHLHMKPTGCTSPFCRPGVGAPSFLGPTCDQGDSLSQSDERDRRSKPESPVPASRLSRHPGFPGGSRSEPGGGHPAYRKGASVNHLPPEVPPALGRPTQSACSTLRGTCTTGLKMLMHSPAGLPGGPCAEAGGGHPGAERQTGPCPGLETGPRLLHALLGAQYDGAGGDAGGRPGNPAHGPGKFHFRDSQ